MLKDFLLVGVGGAFGAMLRYGATLLFAALHWSGNLCIFLVNALGSLFMGLLMGAYGQSPWLLMLTMGLCGGFTTFSTFSMQAVTLLCQQKFGAALLYMIGTVTVCVLFAALGFWAGQKLR